MNVNAEFREFLFILGSFALALLILLSSFILLKEK